MKYPAHLLKLIDCLRKLPGVGHKSAERFAFQMIHWPQDRLKEMGGAIENLHQYLAHCFECGSLIDSELPCSFCSSPARSTSQILCIIASPRDAFYIEETHEYRGLYHVLGGVLSPMDGFGPEKLKIDRLRERIQRHQIKEAIIALDSTVEGDATALYLKQELEPLNVQVTRLAFGLPMGSSLDYVDGGTLARAFAGRRRF